MKITCRQLRRIIREELNEARLPAWERPGYVPEPEPESEEEEAYAEDSANSIAESLAHQLLLNITRSGGRREDAAMFLTAIFLELGGEEAKNSFQTFLNRKDAHTNGRFLGTQ